MKIGVIHYNFPGMALEQFLDYAKDTGFGYVELQSGDVWGQGVSNPEAEAERVKGLLDKRGLKASALSAGNDFILLDEAKIKAQVERMKRICSLAKILGTNVIRTEGGSPKPEVPEDKWLEAMTNCLKRCVPFAEEMNVLLAVDNHGWVTNDGDRELALFKAVGSKNVGANMDTMNYRWFGHDVATVHRFIKDIAPHAFHTHIKDGRGSRSEYVGAVLGEGEIDVPRAIKTLQNSGYQGVYTIEYEGREPSAVGYTRCYEFLKKLL